VWTDIEHNNHVSQYSIEFKNGDTHLHDGYEHTIINTYNEKGRRYINPSFVPLSEYDTYLFAFRYIGIPTGYEEYYNHEIIPGNGPFCQDGIEKSEYFWGNRWTTPPHNPSITDYTIFCVGTLRGVHPEKNILSARIRREEKYDWYNIQGHTSIETLGNPYLDSDLRPFKSPTGILYAYRTNLDSIYEMNVDHENSELELIELWTHLQGLN
jgi:hypothetical protein